MKIMFRDIDGNIHTSRKSCLNSERKIQYGRALEQKQNRCSHSKFTESSRIERRCYGYETYADDTIITRKCHLCGLKESDWADQVAFYDMGRSKWKIKDKAE